MDEEITTEKFTHLPEEAGTAAELRSSHSGACAVSGGW